jgi:hypothetical protein
MPVSPGLTGVLENASLSNTLMSTDGSRLIVWQGCCLVKSGILPESVEYVNVGMGAYSSIRSLWEKKCYFV